jgi:predicted sugar kinase
MPWLATGAVLTAIVAAGLLGWMSPVAVLDIISLWPVLAIVLLPAVAFSIRRRAPAPLLLSLTSFLVLAVGVHYSEWQALPSAAADIARVVDARPEVGTVVIDLDEGELLVSAGSGSYRIKPIRSGGGLGPPAAVESGLPEVLKLEVVERPTNDWFRFSGWAIGLGTGTRWDLTLAAPLLTLDFQGIRVGTAQLTGDGTVRLPAGGEGGLVLAGDFAVSLGPDADAEVVGEALVPADWAPTADGFQSPGGGGGWLITVEPGSVVSVTAG